MPSQGVFFLHQMYISMLMYGQETLCVKTVIDFVQKCENAAKITLKPQIQSGLRNGIVGCREERQVNCGKVA